MVNIQNILSDVQMDIGDLAHTAIQRAEYVDTVNNVLRSVALKTRVWIVRKIYTPNTGGSATPVYQCQVAPADSPLLLLCVYRKRTEDNTFAECREYGYQSNLATLRGESSFHKNNIQLGRINFHTQYMNETSQQVDDGIYLIFNEEIEVGEQIAVDFISGRQTQIVQWTSNMTLQVPDFLEDCIRYGLQWKIMERIFNRGNNEYESRYKRAKYNYMDSLKEAGAMAINYKDLNSTMQITPINYNPE